MKRFLSAFATLAFFASGILVYENHEAISQSVPFNAFSVSTLGGNCTQQGSVMYQSANGQSVCLGAGTAGQVLQSGGPGANVSWLTTGGTGTVTSVGLSLPSFITVSGSPVTASGTLTGTLATQTANTVFAGPVSGGAAAPAFRAIVGDDLPVPGASDLGGVFSSSAGASEFADGIDTSGNVTYSQPAFSDLSGQIVTSQITDANVTTDKIADANVTTDKILDANVTAAKLASGAAVSNIGFTPLDPANNLSDVSDALAALKNLGAVFGQARLVLDTGNLQLNQFDGNFVTDCNGDIWSVASSGPTLAASGSTPGTLYYIYAFNTTSGLDTLEFSTTVPVTASNGVRCKTGDDTKVLVGMARPITGPAWADSATQRFVRSWFNRRGIAGQIAATSAPTTTSTSYVEVFGSTFRVEFLAWADEKISIDFVGTGANNTDAQHLTSILGVDGSQLLGASRFIQNGANYSQTMTCAVEITLSDGYHYAQLFGKVTGGTGTWSNNANETALFVGISQ